MKQIVLRGLRKDETITIVTLFALSFALCEGLMFQALLEDWSSPSERLFDIVLMLTCALFIGGAMAWFIQEYHKCICITENSVILMSGKNVIKTVPKDQIIAYGVYSQHEKYIPGFPFFCYASVNEVSAIADKYWHWRKRIYRKKQLDELEKTPDGMWTVQMSIYIYREHFLLNRNRKYIGANGINKEELHAIRALWQREPMLLGSIALYFPWRHL